MYLGIDIGGTFTDLVLMDDAGRITTTKALTTPGKLEDGLFTAIDQAAALADLDTETLLSRVRVFGHGTTQATNALIERDGAATGLITTRGFGDTLALQRLRGFTAGLPTERLGWYSRRRHPEPIVPRHLVAEVVERVDQAGRVLVPLDEDSANRAIDHLVEQGVQTFAVSLLWSFRHPEHEQRIRELIRARKPDAYISLSSEIAPILGEYERTATTAMNSYLALKVVDYLGKVDRLLRERAFTGHFFVLNSAGGVMPTEEAGRKPVALVASGPAGGVMGSLELAQAMGYDNVITTDMGGTSFDIALIVGGVPVVSVNHEAAGFHLCSPMIDIQAIGAGGGSIARVEAGQLKVGPESASAMPGPVCYGRGGKQVTITDADVVLGIIDPDNFLGGRMKLDRGLAERAIEEQIARPLGMDVMQAAAGIRRIVDDHMSNTLREVTIGRGHDPRDFVLFAYGGAGPVHCASFGMELGVKKIIVPSTGMVHSAYGALASDIHHTVEHSETLPCAPASAARVAELFARMEEQARADIERAGIRREDTELVRSAGLRYRRQMNDLQITLPDGPLDEQAILRTAAQFERTYEATYGEGARFDGAAIDFSIFRLKAVGRINIPHLQAPAAGGTPTPAKREIFEPRLGKIVTADIWQWLSLPVDHTLAGPAVIEHPETAVFVGAGQRANLDSAGNITIESTDAE